jgi:protein O-GlcNAc transferase
MTTVSPLQKKINSIIAIFSSGQIQEALDSVRALIKEYPNEPVPYNISGACYAALGQLDEAVKNYKKSLTIKPDYAEAHNNLAATLQELGQMDATVKHYKKALAIKPDYAEAHNNLGNVLNDLGQLDAAVKSYELALTVKPDYAEAFNNLGSTLKELGQLDTAIKSYEQILTINPNLVEAHNNLGITLKELNQHDAAVKCFERALAIKPDYVDAHSNLGISQQELGQLDAAVKSYEKALAIKPDYAEAHYNLGNALYDLGQLDAAVKSYEKALAIKPDYSEGHNNLGNALRDLNQLDAAVKCFERALAIKPDYADAHNNLGISLQELDQLDEAVKCFEKTLTIKPDYAEVHYNLGNALKKLSRLDAAVKSFEQALAIKPDFADGYNNLGLTLMELDQLDAAIRCYDKALAIKPDFAEAHYNLGNTLTILNQMNAALISFERALVLNPELYFLLGHSLHTKMHLCLWDDLPNNLNELTKKINNNEKVIEPFTLLALTDDPEIQRKTAEIFTHKKYQKNHDLSGIERYPKHKKIRIGYFSADFKEHPVSALTAELYEIHDRNQFEIHAFSYGPDTKDKMNLRIKAGVDHFHEVRMMSHKDVVLLARSLEIDIAVDLGGHTQDARTGIFALLAAPIQISYIGYIGTMGANYYDYLVADQTMIPDKNQKYYSEKIVYLPCFQVNDSTKSPPATIFTRKDLGIPEEGFVFCCFNNTFKITPTTFDSWGRILEKVNGSVLLIYADSDTAKINLTKEITVRGIDPSRLIFGKRLSKPEYLARYRVADLFLDTHPYNAGTTASDALRMGLPVLTYLGNSMVSREAASVINAVNLPELITTNQKEYESLAIELATHPEKLKIIKDKLASNLSTAPLYNTKLFTKNLESAYTEMYDRYQRGLEPDHIYVKH